MTTWHIGRSWPPDTFIEDACPCPKTPCGLVEQGNTSPDCDQHHVGNGHYARTIRQGHKAEHCPGPSVEQDHAAADHHARLAAGTENS